MQWMMAKPHARVLAMFFGVATSAVACGPEVDEPSLEDGDLQETAAEIEFVPRRIRPPNPIDPGWRLLRCLPDPRKTYVAHDPEACAAIRFTCPPNAVPFFDRCGCGCIVLAR